MLGEEMTAPFVVKFHATASEEGPAGAVEECEASPRHIGQSLLEGPTAPEAKSIIEDAKVASKMETITRIAVTLNCWGFI